MLGNIKYYPYGYCRNSTGNLGTDKLFTGQRLDDTGLYYYGARYYDPTIGRFISPDTLVQSPENPQSLNRYSYVFNNPLKYTDPNGLNVYIGGTDISDVEDIVNQIIDYEGWGEEAPDYLIEQLLELTSGFGESEYEVWNDWERFEREESEMADILEQSETVFPYNGAIPEDLLGLVPEDAMRLISNPVGRAWTASNTYCGIRLAEDTGGCSFRTGPGGTLVFEGINPNSNTGNFMSLIHGNPVTFGHVILTKNLAISQEDLTHELGHVYQYSILGPYFLPLYGFDSLLNINWKNKSMETFYIPG